MRTRIVLCSLCGVLMLGGLVACIAGASRQPVQKAVEATWTVTERVLPPLLPVKPIAVVPDRAKILKLAAEMAKQKLAAKLDCGDPTCDCGCNDGGPCRCVLAKQPVTPSAMPTKVGPAQMFQPQQPFQQPMFQPRMMSRGGRGGC